MTGSVEHRCPICDAYEALCDCDASYANEGDWHGGALVGVGYGIAVMIGLAILTAVILRSL